MLVMQGIHEAAERGSARAGYAEIVLEEMDAARRALDRSRPGDTVVLCVDYATEVYKELEARRGMASPAVLLPSEGNGHVEAVGGDPDFLDLTVDST
jgi:cyanophycin synthetase